MPINTLINNADIAKVSEGMQSVKDNYFSHNYLLPSSHPLLENNPGSIIKANFTLTADEIKEYMAVCTLVHTIDGWSYLSNAINAYINGEPSITIHLAYYAELRAAFSLLCSEGILIANNEQVCIDNSNNKYIPSKQLKALKLKNPATHTATWDIINGWITNNIKETNVLEYFFYKGKSFKELIPYIPYSATSNAVQVAYVKKWLQTWCFDISKYKNDREGRNTSSYNANISRQFSPNTLKDTFEILNEFWRLLEPSTDSFSILDQYLFSLYLTKVYDTAKSNRFKKTKEDFIAEFYENSGLSPDKILTQIFLKNEDNSLIKHAKNNQIDSLSGEVLPLTIIARSILLLRFCSGSCSYLFKKNSIVRNDINFYINKVGQDFGIWDNTEPTDLIELWTEIQEILSDFEDYFEGNIPHNLYNLKESFKGYSDTYTQFSRAGLWGLGL